ncbi:MAG: hypothetical protein ABI378_02480 [Chitinophagaceae bacterium]
MLGLRQKFLSNNGLVFLLFGGILFLLYLPAASCGWVSDSLGWLYSIQTESFFDYINRTQFGVRSFYQTTQFVTWIFYQLFGINRWAWHFLHIALHALNCTLLFAFVKGFLKDGKIASAEQIAFVAALLFCCSPYVSEVIVWKASFHYLQGLAFLLGILLLTRMYLLSQQKRDLVFALVLIILSIFSLELWYLTPLFCASMLLFYWNAKIVSFKNIKRTFSNILLPQLLLFGLHLLLVKIILGSNTARLGDGFWQRPLAYFAIKPPMYFFELFGGRFLPQSLRTEIYQFFCTYLGAGLFYGALFGLCFWLLFRLRQMSIRSKASCLFFLWMLVAISLITPMWFPERLLIVGDRYLYIVLPFFFTSLCLLLFLIKSASFKTIIFIGIVASECIGTLHLNRIWQKSENYSESLQTSFPKLPNKHILLLNNPAFYKGAAMIGAGADGEFKLMHNLFYQPKFPQEMDDVLAANLCTLKDSTSFQVLNDSTIRIQLLNKESFWWYGSDYAKNYETPNFSVELIDQHTYLLKLHQAASKFVLLFQQNGHWQQFPLHSEDSINRL